MKKLFTLAAVAAMAFTANAKDITIHVSCDSAPNLWYWGAVDAAVDDGLAWPGAAIEDTKDVNGTTFYYKTFSDLADDAELNVIINYTGDDDKTADITGITEDKYFTYDGAGGYEDVTAEYAGGEPTPVVGNEIYFLGTENGFWDPATASASILETATAGIFEGEVTFTPKEGEDNVWFAVYKEMTGDWGTLNADGNRLQPEENDFPATIDEDMTMVTWDGTDAAWQLDGESAGTYLVTVDTNAMTIKLATIADGIAEQLVKQPTAARFYDLNGRYVGTKVAQKGIYICNGKKYVVK